MQTAGRPYEGVTSRKDREGVLAAVPAHLRSRIVSGMRWTVWLSILAAPFSLGTTTVLARTSPEAVGTYGLLTVYVGFTIAFIYVGGDTVSIKFIPEIKAEQRLSFLVSYFLVICLGSIPWVIAATLWPATLHYLFGRAASSSFGVLILSLSPIYILLCLLVAALKGSLEIQWAHITIRIVTLGSFFIYTALYLADRDLLARHYGRLVWEVFLGLALLATLVGLRRLLKLEGWPCDWGQIRFFLPCGFWRYTLATQEVGLVWFFVQRMDYVMTLNFGGLAVLGRYVAITALAGLIPLINNFFLEALLPSLTNLMASGDLVAAEDVVYTNIRVLLFVNTATTLALILLAGPLTALFGAKYTDLIPLIALLSLLTGLASPGAMGGPLLSCVGKQQRAVWVGLGHSALYVALFLCLWPRMQLLGAVLATGVSLLASQILLLLVAKASVPIRLSLTRDYALTVLLLAGATFLSLAAKRLELATGLLSWTGAMAVFLAAGRYDLKECRELLSCFLPGSLARLLSRGELRVTET